MRDSTHRRCLQSSDGPELSVVLPVRNEEGTLAVLHRRLSDTLDRARISYEVIYVDDGSHDGSLAILRRFAETCGVRVLSLSRNFGHQAAITAGIEHAHGAAVVTMDSDLQDPPEMIPELLAKWRAGYEVVAAERTAREGERLVRRLAILLYYRLLRRIADHPVAVDVGDYRLLDRRVVNVLNALPEKQKYLRGLVSWTGFRQVTVPYSRPARFAGQSKFTYGRLIGLALRGIISGTTWPLRAAAYLGMAACLLGAGLGGYALSQRLADSQGAADWLLTIAGLALLSGMQMIGIGLVGVYLGQVLEEVRARPAYVIAWDSESESSTADEPLAVCGS